MENNYNTTINLKLLNENYNLTIIKIKLKYKFSKYTTATQGHS